MKKDDYTTYDLALASTLYCLDFNFTTSKENRVKVKFLFESSKKLDKVIKDYWDKKLLIEPAKFFQAIKAVKNRIYSY